MKKRKLNDILDRAGLIIAIAVQIGVMVVSMLRLAPSPLEAVGFVLSGIAIVIFAPRAFSKWMTTRRPRYIINYIMLELTSLFFGWSFLVSGTIAQTESFAIQITAENDVVLEEFYLQRDLARARLDEKQEEFNISVREETIRAIQAEQELIQNEIRDLNQLIAQRLDALNRGEITDEIRRAQRGQDADRIFEAIPEAIASGRYVQVVVWFLFVGSISLMIINSLREETPVKKKSAEETRMAGFLEIPKKTLTTLKKQPRLSGCESCGAYELCKSPKFTVEGYGEKKILVVFDSATAKEDRLGHAFVGPEHTYLFSILSSLGLKESDVWVTHAVQCYQPEYENKNPPVSPQSIAGCHTRLIANIKRLKPEKIIVLGSTAMKTLYHSVSSGRFSFAQYDKFPGFMIPDQNLKAVVIPTYSPKEALDELERRKKSILGYKPDAKFSKNLWEDDYLAKTDSFRVLDTYIKKHIREGLSAAFEEVVVPDVEMLYEEDDILTALREIGSLPEFAFDIETTGLKPFAEGHTIWTWGFSDGQRIWAFPHPKGERTLRVLRRVLGNNARKYGWNIQYENIWIKHFLGLWVNNWAWDGMIGAHIHDNRAGITSLKFQAFAYNGVAGYDAEIDKFLQADTKGGNEINNIREADTPRLLRYNGEDAWHTFTLCKKQEQEIKDHPVMSRGYRLFHEGQIALAKMTYNGFRVDMVALQENYMEMDRVALVLYDKIKKAPEVHSRPNFNPNSSQDLIKLFYDDLKMPVVDRTNSGQPSTSSESLLGFYETQGLEIAKDIAEYKTAIQSRDTFLEGIRRETDHGVIHPQYALNLVSSYRSSSQNPNFQNLPKRDEQAMHKIRSVFVPREGYVFMDVDYVTLEGVMGCNYHKDPVMAQYLLDENTDMHADTAMDLFKVKKENVEPGLFKRMRAVGKTANFALQYGSSARNLGYSLWHGHLTTELRAELEKVGITTYEEWGDHTREIYRIYWEERFRDLNNWRKNLWESYVKNGEIASNMGFLYRSKMTMNQVGNFPIQGSGFNILLEGIVNLTKDIEERGMGARFVAEIHDSIVLEVPENEVGLMKSLIQKHFITDIKKNHPWITMPLRMSGEVYRQNWAEAEKGSDFALSA